MIKTYGLTHIALAVKDAKRSYEFYRKVFGVIKVYDQDGFIQAQTPGSHDVLVFDENPPSPGYDAADAKWIAKYGRHRTFRVSPNETAGHRSSGQSGDKSGRKDFGQERILSRRTLSFLRRSRRLRRRDLVRIADAGRAKT